MAPDVLRFDMFNPRMTDNSRDAYITTLVYANYFHKHQIHVTLFLHEIK